MSQFHSLHLLRSRRVDQFGQGTGDHSAMNTVTHCQTHHSNCRPAIGIARFLHSQLRRPLSAWLTERALQSPQGSVNRFASITVLTLGLVFPGIALAPDNPDVPGHGENSKANLRR